MKKKRAQRSGINKNEGVLTSFISGAGVDRSDKKALKYFIRAHKNGYANACVSIATMYLKGDGVKRNSRKAVKYLQVGVQNDIPAAQYTLGLLYLTDSIHLSILYFVYFI